ncbi:serine/threonine-protein kinase KIN2 [Allomyces arbusculus]|nr:serine/threonine-protein kinase KIN2 [Allomyces arbusculus]
MTTTTMTAPLATTPAVPEPEPTMPANQPVATHDLAAGQWEHPFFRHGMLTYTPDPVASTTTDGKASTSSSAASGKRHGVTRLDRYTLGRTLGQGSMGKVKLAMDDHGRKYAVKIVARKSIATAEDDQSAEARILREASVMFLLDHPHIAQLYDAIVTPTHFYFFMEYVNGGQLLDYIVANGRLPELKAVSFAQMILSAIEYCHEHHIVHRDLKIENILLDKKGKIKLIDFGLCNFFDRDSLLHTFCGSLYFASPELLSAQPYHAPPTDIWSFGVILYVLVCARVPFDAPSLPALHAKIRAGDLAFPSHLSPSLVDLLKRILCTDPTRRITIAGIKSHPWFTGAALGSPQPPRPSYVPNRTARLHALHTLFGGAPVHDPASYAAAAAALGPSHRDTVDLLVNITHVPEHHLLAVLPDHHSHLHSLYVLTLEWLDRIHAEAVGIRGAPAEPVTPASLDEVAKPHERIAPLPVVDSVLSHLDAHSAAQISDPEAASKHPKSVLLDEAHADSADDLYTPPAGGMPRAMGLMTPSLDTLATKVSLMHVAGNGQQQQQQQQERRANRFTSYTPAPSSTNASRPPRPGTASAAVSSTSLATPFATVVRPHAPSRLGSTDSATAPPPAVPVPAPAAPAAAAIAPGMNVRLRGPPPSPARPNRQHLLTTPTSMSLATTVTATAAGGSSDRRGKGPLRTLLAGAMAIPLPSDASSGRDPVGRLCALARSMHLAVISTTAVQGVLTKTATFQHSPSVAAVEPTVFSVKLAKIGFGLLGPCLAFKFKSGDADTFRMLVMSLQREWERAAEDGAEVSEVPQQGGMVPAGVLL